MRRDYKHTFRTVLCWKIKKNRLPPFFRVDDMAVPHSTAPWDTRTERGTHYSVSQHHTMRHGDRERYTLQRLTASHHGTRGQREVHITVSHSTTPWNIRTEKGTHCSVSPHHTKRHGDRERYTLQCLTTPHHETRGEREVHMTVSHSTPSYELTTKRGTYDSVWQHHIVRPEDRQKYTITVSPSKDKQEQETGACTSSMPCSLFQLLHWKSIFKSFVRPCAGSHMMRDSRAESFSHWDILVCWTHTQLFFLCWRSNVNKTWKSPSQNTSRILC